MIFSEGDYFVRIVDKINTLRDPDTQRPSGDIFTDTLHLLGMSVQRLDLSKPR